MEMTALPGFLLAYVINTKWMRNRIGMIIIIVSIATRMMKKGSVGGLFKEQEESLGFQSHCEAPDCTRDGVSRQDA